MDREPDDAQMIGFVVRIWLEETPAGSRPARWRGHITHVPSARRRYVQSLGAMIDFIAPYLEAMGARVDLFWRAQRLAWRWIGYLFNRPE